MIYLIFLLILSITNVFGMFNVLEDYRLPGIGKPSDFIIVLLNIMVIFKVITKKSSINKVEKSFVKIVLLILTYVFILIFYSSVITGIQTFNYALRVGGIYLYYSAFLFPIFLLNKKKNFYQFINFIRIGGLVTGGVAIISNIMGYSIATALHNSDYGNFVRVYNPGFFNFFVIIFWTIQFITKNKSKIKIHYTEMLISLAGIILFLGRTRMVVLMLMIIALIYILSDNPKNRRKILIYFTAVVAGIIVLFAAFNFDILPILERFQEGYIKTRIGVGTFSFRIYAITIGFKIFLHTPFVGTGFIHPSSNYYSKLIIITGPNNVYAVTNNADFGLASILFTTGIIGFGLIAYLIIAFLVYVKGQISLLKRNRNFNIKFTYSLTIFIVVLFVFFVEQISGNVFGSRTVTFYMLSMGFAIKILSENNFIKNEKK